ncbi:putative glucose-6-phosphate 1-epimerase isoform X2 [Lingula anatina]|uniref:glucose-6-phosphate 1-epimerase n=1 Tax=Lingula anatina TaxID=7574 RepID=A0A1S3J6M8_LINAN|nr:putative glucose-6-phosphate 1-epimerase isoform X1 [Lingula anatina]XP_013405907.1 putative glucose-6-phosphate 1-epimerase isoform X2 [Lingula anatina]|eukprot:XP_013405906.1 putative glucose-6-phosphate 1-epimerase isoform X1 [Lingula anatina]
MSEKGDIINLTLNRDSNTFVRVHPHGATVIAWQWKGKELLFVSKQAVFDNKKAIRGGIPVVFPNFGPWELGPQHGFARTSKWKVEKEPVADKDGNVTAVLSLEDDDITRALWDYRFKLTYTLTLSEDSFGMKFQVENKDNKPFDFTCLLHTYFRTSDVVKTDVLGLGNLQYIDKVKGGQTFQQVDDPIIVEENVDRIYLNTPNEILIKDKEDGTTVKLTKDNFPEIVLWNPWKEKAAAMGDFGDEEYPNMICVEAGYVHKPYTLQPGSVFEASQTLTVV